MDPDGAAPPAADGNNPQAAKEISALEKNGVKLTDEQKKVLEQKENLQKAQNIKNMIKEFKSLEEPTKVFTEGALSSDKPHLVLQNSDSIPDDYDKMEATKECEYKEGYLAYITEIKEPKLKRATIVNDKTTSVKDIAAGTLKYPVMTGIAVLAVLNKNSLSLFDKEHVNSLLRTFDIMHLTPMVYADNFGEL